MKTLVIFSLAMLGASAIGAPMDGASELNQGYQLLAAKDYDGAIAAFRRGLAAEPLNRAAHKDLAYILLKAGDNIEARDEFGRAVALDARDETAALEYAFLCYETRKPIEARRTFDRLRQHGLTPATRATAQQAFENIDAPLASGIARWKQVLARSPHPVDLSMFSAHFELAELAEKRDELTLAAEQYETCRRLKPDVPSLLLDLARVWQQLNEIENAHAALLAASRCAEPRTAESALELLGPRYPYVYEFQNAVRIDPKNIGLRRELAYLLLALHKDAEAIGEFQTVLEIAPDDQLSIAQLAALRSPKFVAPAKPAADQAPSPAPRGEPHADARLMGRKSLAAGYINDAIRYLNIAHENDPHDAEVMLQLGSAYNIAKDDREAIRWFDAARHSDNPAIAKEADRAWHNLHGASPATTVWAMPLYSSRWKNGFAYGQAKYSLPFTGALPFHFYLSARFIGDARGRESLDGLPPQYLSESSIIVGAGVATKQWHHLLGWAEAGEALNYLPGRHDVGTAIPDYRAGVNWARGFGSLLGAKHSGPFYETTADAVFVGRFDKDTLLYSQNRLGRTFRLNSSSAFQLYANGNYVHDLKNQYWANTVEFGPGARIHLPWLPAGVYLSADWLRGVYTMNRDNPRRPNFTDFRMSFWYAMSR